MRVSTQNSTSSYLRLLLWRFRCSSYLVAASPIEIFRCCARDWRMQGAASDSWFFRTTSTFETEGQPVGFQWRFYRAGRVKGLRRVDSCNIRCPLSPTSSMLYTAIFSNHILGIRLGTIYRSYLADESSLLSVGRMVSWRSLFDQRTSCVSS